MRSRQFQVEDDVTVEDIVDVHHRGHVDAPPVRPASESL